MKLLIKNYKERLCPKADMEHRNISTNGLDVARIQLKTFLKWKIEVR